jgi:hypothetical protein
LDAFCDLSDLEANQVIAILETIPCSTVYVMTWPLETPQTDAKQNARHVQLCQALASKLGLQSARFALRQRFIVSLFSAPAFETAGATRNLTWNSPANEYEPISLESAQALSDYLGSAAIRQDSELSIQHKGDGCGDALCQGIASFKGRAIQISICTVGAPIPFAMALTMMTQVCDIDLSGIYFRHEEDEESNVAARLGVAFLTTFAAGLLRMPRLERLSLVAYTMSINEGVVLLLQKIAMHPTIKTLTLSALEYTKAVDDALADCIRVNLQLESFTVVCLSRTEPGPLCERSALLDAMTTNFTLGHFKFDFEWLRESNPFREQLQRNLDTVCRLNQCGRKYLAADYSNKHKGANVLGAVSDDMNCVYYHLRENPLLLWGEQSKR